MSSFRFAPNKYMALSAAALVATAALGASPVLCAEKTLYRFQNGSDGATPYAGLIADIAGNLYGTTNMGGRGSCEFGGCGTVFKLAPKGAETVLYAFTGGSDGAYPQGGVLMDGAGNIYGTTSSGGSASDGTIFKLSANGTETVLYAFQGGNDGQVPLGDLVSDSEGNFYGVTYQGGSSPNCGSGGCGTAFEVGPTGKENVLHAFQAGSDGALPTGGMVMDPNENLYGTTEGGGTGTTCDIGCGTVFKIDSDGTESILYSFQGADGAGPEGLLLRDQNGNLYGTTSGGGANGIGTVFRLAPNSKETVLYSFRSSNDGRLPHAGVIMDKAGNVYGTTWAGGSLHCKDDGCGTVFEVTAKGKEKILYTFKSSHGRHPAASLLSGAHGALYGTTTNGGKDNNGVVFVVKK